MGYDEPTAVFKSITAKPAFLQGYIIHDSNGSYHEEKALSK